MRFYFGDILIQFLGTKIIEWFNPDVIHFASLMYQNEGIFKNCTTLKESSKNELLRFHFQKAAPKLWKNRVQIKSRHSKGIVSALYSQYGQYTIYCPLLCVVAQTDRSFDGARVNF